MFVQPGMGCTPFGELLVKTEASAEILVRKPLGVNSFCSLAAATWNGTNPSELAE
jgi:hypothetical protein